MRLNQNPQARAAVASLLAAALGDLASRDGSPEIGPKPDMQNWWRYGHESFLALTARHLART